MIFGGAVEFFRGSLIEAGANIEATTDNRQSPLHIAARNGNAEVVRVLLQAGADIERRTEILYDEDTRLALKGLTYSESETPRPDELGWAPIHMAARYGNAETIRAFLEAGDEIRAKTGDTAFQDNPGSSYLVDLYADPDTRPENCGWRPLHIAARYGTAGTVRALIGAGAGIEETEYYEGTPAIMAAKYGSADNLRVFIENGANINKRDKEGRTLLHLAVKQNNVDAVRALLDAGADIEARTSADPKIEWEQYWDNHVMGFVLEVDYYGWTPLHIAARIGNAEIVRALIDAGAQIETKIGEVRYDDHDDWFDSRTALHLAARDGTAEAVRALIEAGADTREGEDGRTPLHIAANHSAEIVRTLIDAAPDRIDARLRDKFGQTPLHKVGRYGSADIVRALVNIDADVNARDSNDQIPLHTIAKHGNPEVARALIQAGANIEARDKNGLTPLHIAAQPDDTEDSTFPNYSNEILLVLIEAGANIEAQDNNSQTPLHKSAQKFHIVQYPNETLHALIEAGANIEARDINFQTPLHIAAMCSRSIANQKDTDFGIFRNFPSFNETLQALIDSDANLEARDENNRTALEIGGHGIHSEQRSALMTSSPQKPKTATNT